MIKQVKDTARAGVTLVELLVVILIVAILAVTMLPMFKKYVVQAQYAAEPIPLVGHIRTQIGLYQYEHNSLPGGKTGCVFGFRKASGDNAFEKIYAEVDDGGTVKDFSTTLPSGATPYLTDMDISANELNGKRISPDQVFYALIKNDAAYEYAIGVFGKKGTGTLPENTGYAVLEAYFPTVYMSDVTTYKVDEVDADGNPTGNQIDKTTGSDKGFKLVATWKNYSGDGVSPDSSQIVFGGTASDGVCVFIPASQLASVDSTDLAGVRSVVNSTLATSTCGKWEHQTF